MSRSRPKPTGARRVQRHREQLERKGRARVEVTVPATDADLVRLLADLLRAGGSAAAAARATLAALLGASQARSGKELLAFFRASPLVGEDLAIERDRSPGREPAL